MTSKPRHLIAAVRSKGFQTSKRKSFRFNRLPAATTFHKIAIRPRQCRSEINNHFLPRSRATPKNYEYSRMTRTFESSPQVKTHEITYGSFNGPSKYPGVGNPTPNFLFFFEQLDLISVCSPFTNQPIRSAH